MMLVAWHYFSDAFEVTTLAGEQSESETYINSVWGFDHANS